ncbi:MAG: hypothetical protein A2808_02460 [Candidatus Moranbacteria bacterium RIFCSPHIGHO2_01_FULL_55_24]|nr:MAG: hypothetical protein A2808_02460 [Candidatus Moranbacteria bacterium RIFCSPHIGHO2_01_FULL_55_24]
MNPEKRRKLVIVADDYGIRDTVPVTLELVQAGKIDRVAVLIREVSESDCERLKATGIPIDLHLDLRGLLASGEQVEESVITRLISFLFRLLSGRLTEARVAHVWREQIEMFREAFGRVPDGLNSHENVHYYPPFFRALIKLAHTHGIAYVRFGKHGVQAGSEKQLVAWILSFLHRFSTKAFAALPRATSDTVTSLDWFGNGFREADFPGEGPIEVIVHPERVEEYVALSALPSSR